MAVHVGRFRMIWDGNLHFPPKIAGCQNLQRLPETQAAAKREADVKAISSKQKAKVQHGIKSSEVDGWISVDSWDGDSQVYHKSCLCGL